MADKSKGHICFFGSREFFDHQGTVCEGNWQENGLDPDGYRLGSRPHPIMGITRQEVIQQCQELIDMAPDGSFWEKYVHPEESEGIFTRVSPDPAFLGFWQRVRRIVPSLFPRIKDGRVQMFAYDSERRHLQMILGPVPGYEERPCHLEKDLYIVSIPDSSLNAALNQLRQAV